MLKQSDKNVQPPLFPPQEMQEMSKPPSSDVSETKAGEMVKSLTTQICQQRECLQQSPLLRRGGARLDLVTRATEVRMLSELLETVTLTLSLCAQLKMWIFISQGSQKIFPLTDAEVYKTEDAYEMARAAYLAFIML